MSLELMRPLLACTSAEACGSQDVIMARVKGGQARASWVKAARSAVTVIQGGSLSPFWGPLSVLASPAPQAKILGTFNHIISILV